MTNETADFKTLALTNYGHFTSMRVEDCQVRGLSLHLARLERDCRTLFGTELDLDKVRELCRRKADGIETAVVRVTVFDPELDLGHPGEEMKPQVLITARPAAELPAPPLRAQAVRYLREVPAAKHVGLFGTIHCRRQAQLAGYDDVLFLDAESNVYEGATWNLGFVSNGQVIWPEGPFLPGVTMRLLQDAHPHVSAFVPHSEIASMDVAFATNANVGVRVIKTIDDTEFVETHPAIAELRNAYEAIAFESL